MKAPSRPNLGKPGETGPGSSARHRRPVVDPKQVDLSQDHATLHEFGSGPAADHHKEPENHPSYDTKKTPRAARRAADRAEKQAARANRKAVKAAQKMGKNHAKARPGGVAHSGGDPWIQNHSGVDTTFLERLEEQEMYRLHRQRLRISSLIGVLLGVLIVLYAVFFSPLFSYQLSKCQVTGARLVDIDAVCQATKKYEGSSLVRLAMSGVDKTVLQEVPELKDVKIHPDWLHGLRIEAIERVPVATVRQNGKVVGVDRTGVILEIAPGEVRGLPQLDVDMEKLGGQTQKLVDAALIAFGDMPAELRSEVAAVISDDPAQLEFKMRDNRTLVWGNSSQSVEKAQVAKLLFTVQGVKVVDVSNPERPSTR